MTDETAKLLADAMNNLAAAINRIPISNGLMPSINVVHHGISSMYQQMPQQPYYHAGAWGGSYGNMGGQA